MTRRILVADDDPNILIALEYILHRNGFNVHAARDGDEVLRQLAAQKPDLVLLDVMMPRRSGYEICRAIRESDDLKGIKIVMLSAKGRDTEIENGIASGADLYITKPFSNADLVARINALLVV